MRPVTRLTVPEIALLSRHAQMSPCIERQYRLNEEDQKIMLVLRDGETNYLKQKKELFTDPTMNYGSLIMKRSANDFDFVMSGKELVSRQVRSIGHFFIFRLNQLEKQLSRHWFR